jgi:hypothetical protein
LSDGKKHRQRESGLTMSEVMTIIILFQSSGFRNFKTYYTGHVCAHPRKEFPGLVSYQRIVELQGQTALPLTAFLQTRFGRCTGISFVDATSIAICHNRRIESNKVFRGLANRGKTSVGWFYGFKVHLVINDSGELLGVMITAGNVDDRKPVPAMTKKLFGKFFGDRGYISQKLFEELVRARPATDHQAQKEYEEQADADDRQTTAAQTSADRNRQRPAQEHLPDRAHTSSLEDQFPGQLAGGSDRLHLSGEKAFAQSPPRPDRGSGTGWVIAWLTSNSR